MRESDLEARIAELEGDCARFIGFLTKAGTNPERTSGMPKAPQRVAGDDLAYLAALETYSDDLSRAVGKVNKMRKKEAASEARAEEIVQTVMGPATPAARVPAATAPAPAQVIVIQSPSAELSAVELSGLTKSERLRAATGSLSVADCRKIIKARSMTWTEKALAARGCKNLQEARAKANPFAHD